MLGLAGLDGPSDLWRGHLSLGLLWSALRTKGLARIRGRRRLPLESSSADLAVKGVLAFGTLAFGVLASGLDLADAAPAAYDEALLGIFALGVAAPAPPTTTVSARARARAASTTTIASGHRAAPAPAKIEPLARMTPRGPALLPPIKGVDLDAAAAAPPPQKIAVVAARPRPANTAPPISCASGRGALVELVLPPEEIDKKKTVAAAPPPTKKISAAVAAASSVAKLSRASGRSALMESILALDEEPAPPPKKTGLPRPSTKKEAAVVRPPLSRLSPVGPPQIEEYNAVDFAAVSAAAPPSAISDPSRKGEYSVMVDANDPTTDQPDFAAAAPMELDTLAAAGPPPDPIVVVAPFGAPPPPAKKFALRGHKRIDSGVDVEPPIVLAAPPATNQDLCCLLIRLRCFPRCLPRLPTTNSHVFGKVEREGSC